jgi:hypothetical protein
MQMMNAMECLMVFAVFLLWRLFISRLLLAAYLLPGNPGHIYLTYVSKSVNIIPFDPRDALA